MFCAPFVRFYRNKTEGNYYPEKTEQRQWKGEFNAIKKIFTGIDVDPLNVKIDKTVGFP